MKVQIKTVGYYSPVTCKIHKNKGLRTIAENRVQKQVVNKPKTV